MANEHSTIGAKVGNMGNFEHMLVISTALVGSKWASTAGDPIMVSKNIRPWTTTVKITIVN
jgi:hypothetical protein